MSNPKYLGWNDKHPTKERPIYVRFDASLGVRRTGKDDGITIKGATAGFTKSDTLDVPNGQLTLYDSYFGPPGNRHGLSMPFVLYMNVAGYWTVDECSGDDTVVVLASVQDAEAAKPYDPQGGKGKPGGKTMTKEEMVAAIAWSVARAEEVAGDSGVSADAAFGKILGCAMFIDWSGQSEDSTGGGIDDSDIPFHPMAPVGGVL